ncbi:MAG: ATP-dependent DNA helicase [Gammaproteobacteria bacterium]|nr:ATP-dependent DNA helicase [Gammaproteobacteria bacterium]
MFLDLTPTQAQNDAIEHDDGNLLILACAGSGKTETLAGRIVHMVRNGADRNSIVAFTFTDHAAEELKQRIRRKLEKELPGEPALGDMYVGTIHSFCLRTLQEQNPRYRLFEVMDDARQAALIATNFVRFEDSGDGIGLDRLRTRTRSKSYGETLRTFLNTLNIVFQKNIDTSRLDDPVLAEAITTYRKIAYGDPNYFFDFNQIIEELIQFLESHLEVLSDLRDRFTHIFVDEYQDVDDRQEHLIRLLTNNGRGPNLTVVGDDDQALYGFRGASVTNILTFKKRYPKVKSITLKDNFRSTHAIVSIADEAVRSVKNRISKEPVARIIGTSGSPEEHFADPGDIQLQTFSTEDDEADWVAERILALRGVAYSDKGEKRGLDYGDMAILLRSVRNSGAVFVERLRKKGIPVVISGVGGLFDNDEIRVIQAAFCLLAKSEFAVPDANGHIKLLSTGETRDFVRKAIDELKNSNCFGQNCSSTHFLSFLDQTRANLDQRALPKPERPSRIGARIYPQAIFQEMLKELGAHDDNWPPSTLFNLGAFSNLLTSFEAVHQWITPARLKNLTLFLSNWAAKYVDEGALGEVGTLNSVRIMTVHAAKGLEWPVVFLPRVSSAIFPSSKRTREPDTFLSKDTFDLSDYISGDDGERRLWYVALTRCSKFLHVSSLDRTRKRPTKYFTDIAHDCVRRDRSDPTPREKLSPTPPAGSNMLPTTYSDLAAYWRCKREYQLRSLMNFSPGVGEQFGYGRQVHNILAEIHLRAVHGTLIKVPDIPDLVDEFFHLRYTRGEPLDKLKEAAVKGLTRYVEKFGNQIRKAQAVEKRFEFVEPDSGALISGVVDLLERGSESTPPSHREIVGIIDFKVKKINSLTDYEAATASAAEQLQMYAVGVQYALDCEPGSAAVHIISHAPLPPDVIEANKDERMPVDISESARGTIQKRVAETVREIRTGMQTQKFETSGVATGSCRRCDFRSFCPGFKQYKSNKPDVKDSGLEDQREQDMKELTEDLNARQ